MKIIYYFTIIGIIILIGCDNHSDGNTIVNVPLWAQGTWYTDMSSSAIKVAEITSSQYIAFQVTGYDNLYNPIVAELLRMDCTSVTNDMVVFARDYQVKKLDSSNQISVGSQGIWITIYKKNNNGSQSYNIIYNANGGSGTMANSTHIINEAKNLNANSFTRNGYNFIGWSTSATGSVEYLNEQRVTNLSTTAGATVTLYAKWGQSYTVIYNANGGSGIMENSIHLIDETKKLNTNTFTRTGYNFIGWAFSATGLVEYSNEQSVSNLSTTSGATVTLYSIWNPISYKITYNANGGSGIMVDSTHIYDEAKPLNNNTFINPTDSTFIGWATSSTGNIVYTDNQIVNNLTDIDGLNVTLYAVWYFTYIVPGSNLAAKLTWLQNNALNNSNNIVEVNNNESINSCVFNFSGINNITITLVGIGAERIISLSSNGYMFAFGSTITLILENNITLLGRNNNTDPLIRIYYGGTLIMNSGSQLTGNINTGSSTSSSPGGGGVVVYSGGTFIMNGGSITDNSFYSGGGVSIGSAGAPEGIFTMNDGEISGNFATGGGLGGGGVYVNNGIFTMNGGKIFENTSTGTGNGGGVYVWYFSRFIMNGGEIFGNSARNGGGIYLNSTTSLGALRLCGGIIYGSDEAVGVRNTVSDSGAALFKSNNNTAQYGIFNGSIWNSNGDLQTTNNTISVLNGSLQ